MEAYPGTLPEAGGLLDQDEAIMKRLEIWRQELGAAAWKPAKET